MAEWLRCVSKEVSLKQRHDWRHICHEWQKWTAAEIRWHWQGNKMYFSSSDKYVSWAHRPVRSRNLNKLTFIHPTDEEGGSCAHIKKAFTSGMVSYIVSTGVRMLVQDRSTYDLHNTGEINGQHLYSAFIQSAVQFLPLTHLFTHQRRLAAMQGTNQLVRSNWGLGVLLRDTSTRPLWDQILIHLFTHQRRLAAMQSTNQLVRSNWGLVVLLRDTSTRPLWDQTLIHLFTHQRRLAAMKGTNQLVRSNWGLGVLLRDTSTHPEHVRLPDDSSYPLSHIAPFPLVFSNFLSFLHW